MGYSYKIAKYLDELFHDDNKKRLNSVGNLMKIIGALGPERTIKELLVLLEELLDDEEPIQVLYSQQLYKMFTFLGQDSLVHIMPHIERLLTSEDSSVRESTMTTLQKIYNVNSIQNDEIFKLAQRLYNKKNGCCRVSSLMIVTRMNKYINKNNLKDILKMIKHCARSDIPTLRSAVAWNLKYLLREAPYLQNEGLEFLKKLSKDLMDSVRVSSVESIMFRTFETAEFMKIIWPLIKNLFEDESWRVRYAVIQQILSICQSAGKENVKKLILPYYARCMVDNETELKNFATEQLQVLVQFLSPEDIINKITPIISTLVNDKHSYVRASLAKSVLHLSPILGKKSTNTHILGIFLSLLRDDSPEVRINIFKTFSELTKVLPANTLIQSILPVFLNLGNNPDWKNRVQCLETLVLFERDLGTEFVNDKKIQELIVKSLSDKIFTVRVTAIDTLKNISKRLGSGWAEKYALPILNSFEKNNNYLYRMNYYMGIKALTPFLSSDMLRKVGFKIIKNITEEKVENIKIIMLQALREIEKINQNQDLDKAIKAVYSTFAGSKDSDVRYYANKFLSK